MKKAMRIWKSRRPLVLAFTLTLAVVSHTARAQDGKAPLALQHTTVLDLRTGALRADQTVVVMDGRIAAVGASGDVKAPDGAKLVDGAGWFVMPGLWDMHVHLVFGDWFPGGREVSLPLFVANGVTGVRDMGSDLEAVQQWRREIAAGTLIGPRIYTAGPM